MALAGQIGFSKCFGFLDLVVGLRRDKYGGRYDDGGLVMVVYEYIHMYI